MYIKKGDKQLNVPAWVIVAGLLVVDNLVVNVCKTIDNKNLFKASKNKEKETH